MRSPVDSSGRRLPVAHDDGQTPQFRSNGHLDERTLPCAPELPETAAGLAPRMTHSPVSAARGVTHRGLASHPSQAVSSAAAQSPRLSRQRSDRPAPAWSRAISLEALFERLALLFQLEVPCTLHLKSLGTSHARRTSIHRWERRDGRLVLSGERFSLHLGEEDIETACVIHRCRNGKLRKVLELRDKKGTLRARILGPCSDEGAAVWHDVMDTFILPMADAEEAHLEIAH